MIDRNTQCITLAPVVGLKAETASPEDKEWLAGALFYLRKPSTGSLEGDVKQLSIEIQQYVVGYIAVARTVDC